MLLSPRYSIFLLIVLFAIVTAAFRITMQESDMTIKQSPNDQREYRSLLLENGLKVILVSDINTDKAAASLAVNVGSGDDPKDREGLAHFLEHMLFLGTQPFPKADEYQSFINQHGGSHNAFTAHDTTNFYFEIDNDSLSGALDRFAPFFISPTFDETYVEREKNAVNAEFTAKSQDDGRRIYSAEKQAMNPQHPYAQFSTGNLKTLEDRPNSLIRDELISFYKSHYSADKMTLAIIGNYDLDTLEHWTKDRFNHIPKQQTLINSDITSKRPELYQADQLPLDLQIEPIKELRQLKLAFPMPESLSTYQYKPLQIINHLLGHEGDGSLLALFKQRGWAEGLSAGRGMSTPWESTLSINIQLTMIGLYRVDEISAAVLAYIDLIKQGLQDPEFIERIYSEQRQLSELSFINQEKSKAGHYAVRLSNNLRHLSPDNVIYGDYQWITPNIEILKPFLDRLTANNLIRTLIAPEVETNMLDPWYDTKMMLRPAVIKSMTADGKPILQPAYKEQLFLPSANPFIPQSFTLTDAPAQDVPTTLIDQAGLRLWYYPEQEFRLPKASVVINFQNSDVANHAKDRIIAQLFSHSVNELISSYTYPAYVAGLNYQLQATARGLELTLSGYHDKLPVLLQTIITTMASLNSDNISEEAFDRYKVQLKRRLENQLKAKPYERTISELRRWLRNPSFDQVTLINALDTVTLSDILAFNDRLTHNVYIDAYVHGTIEPEAALNIGEELRMAYQANEIQGNSTQINDSQINDSQINNSQINNSRIKAERIPPAKINKVPNTATHNQYFQTIEQQHPDHAATLYIQGQQFENITSDKSRAAYALLAQVINTPYYQWLRTEKKLGYIVSASPFPQNSVPGLIFIVQSPTATAVDILAETELFFTDFNDQLLEMSAIEFEEHKQGLISRLLSKKKNMGEKMGHFWHNIDVNRLTFDTNESIAREVELLSLSDIQTLYTNSIIDKKDPRLLFAHSSTLPSADESEDLPNNQSRNQSQYQPRSKWLELSTLDKNKLDSF